MTLTTIDYIFLYYKQFPGDARMRDIFAQFKLDGNGCTMSSLRVNMAKLVRRGNVLKVGGDKIDGFIYHLAHTNYETHPEKQKKESDRRKMVLHNNNELRHMMVCGAW